MRFFPALLFLLVAPTMAAAQWESDPWLEKPVSDEVFAGYQAFFSYDRELPFDATVLERVTEEGIQREKVRFTSTPGVEVMAEYLRTRGSEPTGRPHVVMVHGGSAEGKASIRRLAERFVRNGINVLAIDMIHFGERNTGLLTSYTEQEKHERLYNRPSLFLSFIVQTVKDVGRSFDFLVEHHGADPARIGYMGFSRGAQTGFIVTGVDKRFSAVGLMYGGHFDRFETGHLAAACPANYVGHIAPTPLWILNGTFDSDYDRQRSVEPLHRLLSQPAEIHWVDTGHQYPDPVDVDRLAGWMLRHLR